MYRVEYLSDEEVEVSPEQLEEVERRLTPTKGTPISRM
jgi:hypothetical protein